MILTAQIAVIGMMMAPTTSGLSMPATPNLSAQGEASNSDASMGRIDQAVVADHSEMPAPTPPAAAHHCNVCGPVYAKRDPLIGLNRALYAINQPIDRFVVRPPAMVYMRVMPKPGRDGLRNFLNNIYAPVTFVNDVIQLRPKRALTTLGRFVINTTVGIGGLFDAARRKPFHMQGHLNNFSNSLAMLGISPGPYLYLPIIGPTTFRDMIGAGGDTVAAPYWLGRFHSSKIRSYGAKRQHEFTSFKSNQQFSTFGLVLFVLSGLERRADADGDLKALKVSSVDPYVTLREAYLQNRESEVALLQAKAGQAVPVPSFDDPLTDPAAPQPAMRATRAPSALRQAPASTPRN